MNKSVYSLYNTRYLVLLSLPIVSFICRNIYIAGFFLPVYCPNTLLLRNLSPAACFIHGVNAQKPTKQADKVSKVGAPAAVVHWQTRKSMGGKRSAAISEVSTRCQFSFQHLQILLTWPLNPSRHFLIPFSTWGEGASNDHDDVRRPASLLPLCVVVNWAWLPSLHADSSHFLSPSPTLPHLHPPSFRHERNFDLGALISALECSVIFWGDFFFFPIPRL